MTTDKNGNALKEGDWVLYQGERYQVVEIQRETLLFSMIFLGADLWVHTHDVELIEKGVQS